MTYRICGDDRHARSFLRCGCYGGVRSVNRRRFDVFLSFFALFVFAVSVWASTSTNVLPVPFEYQAAYPGRVPRPFAT